MSEVGELFLKVLAQVRSPAPENFLFPSYLKSFLDPMLYADSRRNIRINYFFDRIFIYLCKYTTFFSNHSKDDGVNSTTKWNFPFW